MLHHYAAHLSKWEITHTSDATYSINCIVPRERKWSHHSPPKSSVSPQEFSTLETDTEKYLNKQAVINLPKNESTIYFQFSISKVNGWFAGLVTGYKDFYSHGTCSQWQLCVSYYHPITLWSQPHSSEKASVFTHTHAKSQQHFLRWDLLSLSCRQARN